MTLFVDGQRHRALGLPRRYGDDPPGDVIVVRNLEAAPQVRG